jgi:uncharacterized membrane protein (UPF0127 family)
MTRALPAPALLPAFILLASAMLVGCDGGAAPTSAKVKAGGTEFTVKLAMDNASREKGLGGVTSLAPDEGMLFVFTDSLPRNFWMVDCVMDIDIAFVDPFGFVTAVHTMPKEPLQADGEGRDAYFGRLKRYPSLAPAQFAFEVAPGRLAELGVKRGVRLEFDRDTLKKHAK